MKKLKECFGLLRFFFPDQYIHWSCLDCGQEFVKMLAKHGAV